MTTASLTTLLQPHGTLRTYQAGELLLFQGEIPRAVYVLLHGTARAYLVANSGDEQYAGLYHKGDIIPLAFALGQSTTALFHYDAVSDIRVLTVAKNAFDTALQSEPSLTQQLLALVGREYTSQMLRITALSQSRTIDKLAYTFYYLLTRYGLARTDGWYVIDLKITQTMLGSLIGQTREGTARNLKILSEKDIISYKGSVYHVHKNKLIALLGEDAFRELVA